MKRTLTGLVYICDPPQLVFGVVLRHYFMDMTNIACGWGSSGASGAGGRGVRHCLGLGVEGCVIAWGCGSRSASLPGAGGQGVCHCLGLGARSASLPGVEGCVMQLMGALGPTIILVVQKSLSQILLVILLRS